MAAMTFLDFARACLAGIHCFKNASSLLLILISLLVGEGLVGALGFLVVFRTLFVGATGAAGAAGAAGPAVAPLLVLGGIVMEEGC